MQTEDIGGPPTPTIAADFSLIYWAIAWDFYFMRNSVVGEKTWKGLREYLWEDVQETSNTLGKGTDHLFEPREFWTITTTGRF